MKPIVCVFLLLTSFVFGDEDLKFFEDRYAVKIEGVKALSECEDSDSFYVGDKQPKKKIVEQDITPKR